MVRKEKLGKGKRIVLHYRGLVKSITDWVELRIELAESHLWQRVADKVNVIAYGLLAMALGVLAAAGLLTAAALGIGQVFGDDAWGFLVVGSITGIIAWLLIRDWKSKWSDENATISQEAIEDDTTNGEQIGQGSSGGPEGDL